MCSLKCVLALERPKPLTCTVNTFNNGNNSLKDYFFSHNRQIVDQTPLLIFFLRMTSVNASIDSRIRGEQ